jgi:hypothetical protein
MCARRVQGSRRESDRDESLIARPEASRRYYVNQQARSAIAHDRY